MKDKKNYEEFSSGEMDTCSEQAGFLQTVLWNLTDIGLVLDQDTKKVIADLPKGK